MNFLIALLTITSPLTAEFINTIQIHKKGSNELVRIWGFGDKHSSTDFTEERMVRRKKEKKDLQEILEEVTAYKGEEKLVFLVEDNRWDLNFNGCTQVTHLRENLLQPFLYKLYDNLNTAIQGSHHVVQNIDKRNVIAAALTYFHQRHPLSSLQSAPANNSTKKNISDLTFSDLLNEMKEQLEENTKQIESIQRLTLPTQPLLELLEVIKNKITDFTYYLAQNNIPRSQTLDNTARIYYADGDTSQQPTDNRGNTIFSQIENFCYAISNGTFALDLFHTTYINYLSNNRVVIFAGNKHIRDVQQLYREIGYCTSSTLHDRIITIIFTSNPELKWPCSCCRL